MRVAELRNQLHDYINFADEQFLNIVYSMVKDHKKSNNMVVVGYHPDGTPITKLELLNDNVVNCKQHPSVRKQPSH